MKEYCNSIGLMLDPMFYKELLKKSNRTGEEMGEMIERLARKEWERQRKAAKRN